MFYHVKWYRKPLLRDEGGAFCVGKRVGAVAPYQYKVGQNCFLVRPFLGDFIHCYGYSMGNAKTYI